MGSGLYHLCSYPLPSTVDLPSASAAAGFYPLTRSVWICVVTRSQLDPMLFHHSTSALLSQKALNKGFIPHNWRQHTIRVQREGRERWTQEDSVTSSGCCEDGSLTGVTHFCGQCSGFTCSWKGREDLTHKVLTRSLGYRGHLPVSLKFLTVVKTHLLKLGGQKVKERIKGKRNTLQNGDCKMISESCRQWKAVMWRQGKCQEWFDADSDTVIKLL